MLWESGIQNVLHETTLNPILFEEIFYLYFVLFIYSKYNINIYLFNLGLKTIAIRI